MFLRAPFYCHLSTFHGTQYMYVHCTRTLCARTGQLSTVAAIILWIHMVLMGQGKPGFAKQENGRGSVAPLSRMREGKPGFAERSRERRASETAEHD